MLTLMPADALLSADAADTPLLIFFFRLRRRLLSLRFCFFDGCRAMPPLLMLPLAHFDARCHTLMPPIMMPPLFRYAVFHCCYELMLPPLLSPFSRYYIADAAAFRLPAFHALPPFFAAGCCCRAVRADDAVLIFYADALYAMPDFTPFAATPPLFVRCRLPMAAARPPLAADSPPPH